MTYQRHDPASAHPGYQGNNPFFDEEESKYNNAKYDSKDGLFSGYKANEEREEKEPTEFEKQIEEEQKPKYGNKEENQIVKKAAQEISREVGGRRPQKRKKSKSIEEAIEKAIKEEKDILVLNR
ncbi:hypothetical protein GF323_01600 [Candidatus Woesearchaeota archaeon]|nr:hypothetical protein [Candidatus Woesearchaeota archaeon]